MDKVSKITIGVILGVIALLFILFLCNRPKGTPTQQGTIYDTLANGDTLFYIKKDTTVFYKTKTTKDTVLVYKTTKDTVGSYTYTIERVELHPKQGGTQPPIPPQPGNTRRFVGQIIPFSEPDMNSPGRGVEQWHNGNDINVPVEGTNTQRIDVYFRFVWTRLEGRTQGSYTWSYFDNLVNTAISKGQKLSFGIMSVFPGNESEAGGQQFSDGGWGCFPEYIHKAMQLEGVKDWKTGQTWTPNYNSNVYLSRVLALNQALNAHIEATSHLGVPYKNVIHNIDIRHYGAWGEWHSAYTPNNNVSDYPSGTFPTATSLKKLVDAYTTGFPNHQLVCMIAAFDAQYLNNTWNPPEIAHYLLNVAKNNRGVIGWRRDQWGATDTYLSAYLENNTRNFNGGVPFNVPIMERYKTAPITGEPPAWNPGDYYDLERQIRLYHASSFGNGNYGTTSFSTTLKNNVRAASKASGYRIQIDSGFVTSGTTGKVVLYVSNRGIAPTYETWNTVIKLKQGTTVVWTGNLPGNLRLFLPTTTPSRFEGNFQNIPVGNYTFTIEVVDPTGFRKPLTLANRNRNTDGSYILIP